MFVYIVRCNFTEPAKEQAWNAWYSGPKIGQMLAKPHFRSCQRFQRVSGDGRNYLALWTVQSPDAFKTQAYTTDWGFFDWGPYITDWSRDLFDGDSLPETAFAVPPQGLLDVMAFDGMSADQAQMAIKPGAGETMWLPIAGLDRHTPVIGLRVLRDQNSPAPDVNGQRATYRPICQFFTTPNA